MSGKSAKKAKKADLGLTVVLIIGILAVANFFSYQAFWRWDLTLNKIFSVSDATKNTLRGLEDIVSIKAYFSANLPGQVLSIRQEVADILGEYEAYAGGRVKADFIDPSDNQKLQQELGMLGIPQLTFEVYEKDKLELVNGYMGITVSFGGKTEVIPAVKQNTGDLEYQLTTAIKKVTVDEIARIGYLATQETRGLDEELSIAKQELSELYTVLPVMLGEEDPGIAAGINTLVIAGPRGTFSEDQLKAINGYIANGGALLVLMDGVNIEPGLLASKNPANLGELLAKYGLTLNQDLVADRQSGVASFSQGFFTFSSNYVFWPKLLKSGFNQDNSAVANLDSVILPWASSIEFSQELEASGAASSLAFTTDQGWRVSDNFDIAPNASLAPQGEQKSYTLAGYVNGAVPNPYPAEGQSATMNARIIAVGDSDFMTDGFLRNSPDNLTLFQNLVDILSFDEDLINIRSKGVTSRPVKELSEGEKAAIRYLNIFGLTGAVVAFGLVRYYLRRRSRFIDDI